jgi:MraZ protein
VIESGDPDWQSGAAPQLVIVYGETDRSYLECYTINAIDEVDDKIDSLPRGSMPRKMLQRLYHGLSFPTSVDETGRLVLPAKLRTKIGLQGEALFFATGDTFQIWNPDTYEAVEMARAKEWLATKPEGFDLAELLDGDPALLASDTQASGETL